MSAFADEIEKLRQRLNDEAASSFAVLVRLGAELERHDSTLINELRGIVQAHERRRDVIVSEIMRLRDNVSSQASGLSSAEMSPAAMQVSQEQHGTFTDTQHDAVPWIQSPEFWQHRN
ncbi:MAG: hypothetical protein ACKOW3_00005 [Hyphomicrobium sp.]